MTVDREIFGDSLPTYLTRFVGRQREVAEVVALTDGRLVTLCGVGGIGKTRLAIEVARLLRTEGRPRERYAEVYWISLAAVADPADVPAEVAAGVGLRGASGGNALLIVVNALRNRQVLVVLDNCEHVASACREMVCDLLKGCPTISVLTTSRVPLQAAEEQVYAVPPMREEAVDLFVDRAMWSAPTYALTDINAEPIGHICQRLAGLPLAIELAAGWIRVLSPLDLMARLGPTLNTKTAGGMVEDRHRSIEAVLDSTWQWLSRSDQAVMVALAAFRGGFTLDAAEYVARASLSSLATLTERAMVQRLPDSVGGSRYQLHELVREYAVSRLEADGRGVADAVRSRHFDYYLRMAQGLETPSHTAIEPTLNSPIAAEQGNLDAAMSWALDRGDAERALLITDALDAFWVYSVPRNTNRVEHLTRALAIPWTDSVPEGVQARGKALNRLAYIELDHDPATARELFRESLKLFESIDDRVGVAASARGIGWADYAAGDLDVSRDNMTKGLLLAREAGDTQGEAWATHGLGVVASLTNDFPIARSHLREAVALFEENSAPFGVYRARLRLAEVYRRHRLWLESIENYRQALDLQREHQFTTEGADLLEGLALTAGALHRVADAARLVGASATWRAVHDELPHDHHQKVAEHIVRFKDHVGADAWSAAHQEGARLTTDQVAGLAYAVMRDLKASLAPHPAGLTDREIELLRLLARGLSNASIADQLVISPRTVHAHLRSIFEKLDVKTRTAAAHRAIELNLV